MTDRPPLTPAYESEIQSRLRGVREAAAAWHAAGRVGVPAIEDPLLTLARIVLDAEALLDELARVRSALEVARAREAPRKIALAGETAPATPRERRVPPEGGSYFRGHYQAVDGGISHVALERPEPELAWNSAERPGVLWYVGTLDVPGAFGEPFAVDFDVWQDYKRRGFCVRWRLDQRVPIAVACGPYLEELVVALQSPTFPVRATRAARTK